MLQLTEQILAISLQQLSDVDVAVQRLDLTFTFRLLQRNDGEQRTCCRDGSLSGGGCCRGWVLLIVLLHGLLES